jgi:hypothetical protein
MNLSELIRLSYFAETRPSEIRGLNAHIPEVCLSGYQKQVPAGSVSELYIEILASTQNLYLVEASSRRDDFKFEVIANIRLWVLLKQMSDNNEAMITARVFPKLTANDIDELAKSELFTSLHSLFPHKQLIGIVLAELCSSWGKNLIKSMIPGLTSKQQLAQLFGYADRSSLERRKNSGARND